VKTCRSCGLPAPRSTLTCAYCSGSFPAPTPAVYRLAPGGSGYHWLRHESVLIFEAQCDEGTWPLRRPGSDEALLTLVARGTGSGSGFEPALIDARGRLAATLSIPGADLRTLAVARDDSEALLAEVRSDGPSGIHLIDDRGEVTALASRAGTGRRAALDVLVTRPAGDAGEALLFGILLGLELTRLGELRAA